MKGHDQFFSQVLTFQACLFLVTCLPVQGHDSDAEPLVQEECSKGGWYNNGSHLDKGREKAVTLPLHLFGGKMRPLDVFAPLELEAGFHASQRGDGAHPVYAEPARGPLLWEQRKNLLVEPPQLVHLVL